MHVYTLGQAEASEFNHLLNFIIEWLYMVFVLLKNTHQLQWSWIQTVEHEASENFEQAAYEYTERL